MIFNEMMKTDTSASNEAVNESQYELGIGGALMHVYENECNYNALIKAAALSEMKYYNENGGDLFVQEAGALSSFVTKVKEFFKKIIEKIKSIAKKFFAVINQYTMKDKDFVKKYQTELIRRDLKDFEYNGYKFRDWTGNVKADGLSLVAKEDPDQDDINDAKEANRGKIVGGSGMTEAEFRDELKEKLYGDKEDFAVEIRTQLGIISDNKKTVDALKKEEKEAVKAIEDIIKKLENEAKALDKGAMADAKAANDADAQAKDKQIKKLNRDIDVYKAFSNDVTVYFGAKAKALADMNRQAKAICVKALSYKHEAATVAESNTFDIFAGVEIV